MGLVHPTTKPAQHEGFSPGKKKRSPPGEAHSVLNTLHQESQYINVLPHFLSLCHFYIQNPKFLSILFPAPNLGRLRQIDRHTEAEHETELDLGLDEKIKSEGGRKKLQRKFYLFIIRYRQIFYNLHSSFPTSTLGFIC